MNNRRVSKNRSDAKTLRGGAIALLLPLILGFSSAKAEQVKTIEPSQRDPFLEKMLKSVLDHNPTSEEMQQIGDYIAKHPNDSDGHLLLADAYNKLGMDELYADELEKAWTLNPKAMMYIVGALKARAMSGDVKNFDRLVDATFKAYENQPNMLTGMALLFQTNKQDKLAIRFLSKAIELAPNDMKIREDYCTALLAMKRYKDVEKAVEPLFSNCDFTAHASLLKGLALYNMNETKRAIPLLKTAYLSHPDSPDIDQSYYAALMSDGQTKEALTPALMALAMQPIVKPDRLDDVKANIRPAIAKASHEDLIAAIENVKAKIPAGRALAYFYFSLGDLLDKEGKIRQAIECYTAGLDIDKNFGRAFMRLGHDMDLLGAPSNVTGVLFEQAAMRTPNDQQVLQTYLRMKDRSRVQKNDLAAKLKHKLNRAKYKN